MFWTQNWISSRENILINTMMHCGVLGLTQLKVWNVDLLQKRRKQFEVCWTRRELLHQGALGLPDCLPATVSPPTSHYSATTFFPNQPTPSTHCAATAESFDQVSGLFSSSLHTSSSLHVHTSVKVEVILQEQFPTTSGPEETAHIPVLYTGTQVLLHSGTHAFNVLKVPIPRYSR